MVKCADCGFLTMRNKFTGNLEEVDAEFRTTGEGPTIAVWAESDGTGLPYPRTTNPFARIPICFAQAHNLAGNPIPQRYEPSDLLEIITKERICPPDETALGFTPWQQGFTPKEHRERQLELERDLAIRDRELERDQRAETWHKEGMEELRKQHRSQLIVLGIFVGLVTLIASIAGGILDGLVSRGVDVWPF